MIPTFVYEPSSCDGVDITVSGHEAHHMTGVIRLHQGETVRLIDGCGLAHICEIAKITTRQVICRIIKSISGSGEPGLHLTLAIGLSTGFKFDLVIEKGTEVGVSRFVPLLTEKGRIRKADLASLGRKMTRWRRVAEAAVKQSGRSVFPKIDPPTTWNDFLTVCKPEETILFHPAENPISPASHLRAFRGANLTLLVGPESGFSMDEIALAAERGIPAANLGERILRTETAGVVLSALAIYVHEMVNLQT